MTVTMEALLVGHEDWVFSVAWQPDQGAEPAAPCLLSASMDRTMMLWRPEASTGLPLPGKLLSWDIEIGETHIHTQRERERERERERANELCSQG